MNFYIYIFCTWLILLDNVIAFVNTAVVYFVWKMNANNDDIIFGYNCPPTYVIINLLNKMLNWKNEKRFQ